MKGFSLCSGIGGLDIAMQQKGVQTIGYSEIEPYAQAILHARMRDGWLDSAPIWPDIKTLEKSHIGNVDIIYGGIPCQPHSIAGKRKREEDARDLWPDTYRILRDVRPRFFFLENVSGFSTRSGESPAFAWRVLDDLTRIGYDVRWTHVAAKEVGAPHRRKRFFLLAYTRCEPKQFFIWFHGKEPETSSSGVAYTNTGLRESKEEQILPRWNTSGNIGSELGDPTGSRQLESTENNREAAKKRKPRGITEKNIGNPSEGRTELGDTNSQRLEGWNVLEDDTSEWISFPSGPDQYAQWDATIKRYGHLAPAIKSNLRGRFDGFAIGMDKYRRKRLEGLGNGVVPQQAMYAIDLLTS